MSNTETIGQSILHQGDCREVLATLPSDSIDSIVTDPPYGLGFMGKGWDHAVPGVEFWQAMLRVAKPGAYLLAFGGTRTFHRMVCAIEDAGWEIRDTIMWLYGSGFPKSHNGPWGGTALKPAHEPIIMARKPLVGTVAANVLAYGTGALNIDGCRIAGEPWRAHSATGLGSVKFFTEGDAPVIEKHPHDAGRWPANVIHDGSEEVLAAFPDAPGQQRSVGPEHGSKPSVNCYGDMGARPHTPPRVETEKSAARFFYCAKASRADRNEGLEGLVKGMPLAPNGAENAVGSNRGSRSQPRENIHPTVKPTDLMRYLCRLVTPPGGLVLDPFMGSGSTGKGALLEGFRFVGIEQDAAYFPIAAARVHAAQPEPVPEPEPDLQADLFAGALA